LRDQSPDPAFEVLARDQIDGVDAIGQDAEQETPVEADAMPHHGRTESQTHGADESGGIAAGEASMAIVLRAT
jgi:hypothetical protein